VTEQDKRNNEIIIKIISEKMGYTDESLKIFIDRLTNPQIDDEYAKIIGPDLRASWEIPEPEADAEHENQAWSKFKSFFHYVTCRICFSKIKLSNFNIITYSNFLDNSILFKKNIIKLKKYLTILFLQEPSVLSSNFNHLKNDDRSYYEKVKEAFPEIIKKIEDKDPNNLPTEEEIVTIIIKLFEKIGEYSYSKKKKGALVLSCNFADWFLSSTKENWTSCFNIEDGYFWYAVPGLIGDSNRSMLYVTNGSSKEFEGIVTERFKLRTWVILDENNGKNIVGFYPQRDSYTLEKIKKITGDNSYEETRQGEIKDGKRPIVPIFFKSGVYSTTSQDATKMEKKGESLILKIGNGAGTQYFGKSLNTLNSNIVSVNRISYHNANSKMTASNIFKLKVCKCGNSDALIEKGENYYCKKCFDEKYVQCHCCKTIWHKSKRKMIVEDGETYCSDCHKELFIKCENCGENLDNRKAKKVNDKYICSKCFNSNYDICNCCKKCFNKKEEKTIIVEGRSYCVKCLDKEFKKCRICNKYHPKENFYKNKELDVCKQCYKENFHKCKECKKTFGIKDILIIHDKEKDMRMKRCADCIKKIYPKHIACVKCNEFWEPERMHADGTCPKCNGEEY
jgi:hypothetical protein